jgi:hypothetical protein
MRTWTRPAGPATLTECEIGEIVANLALALSLFTNDVNHLAATEFDFPVATRLEA